MNSFSFLAQVCKNYFSSPTANDGETGGDDAGSKRTLKWFMNHVTQVDTSPVLCVSLIRSVSIRNMARQKPLGCGDAWELFVCGASYRLSPHFLESTTSTSSRSVELRLSHNH